MQKPKKARLTTGQWAAIGAIVAALLGALGLIISTIIEKRPVPLPPTLTNTITPSSTNASTPTFTPAPTQPTLTPTPTPLTGKPVGDIHMLPIMNAYDPSGHMGDIGDITVAKQGEVIRFTYDTRGRGPYEWDWKYVDCAANPNPARFSGVMILDPPNNWGTIKDGGHDLRGFKTIRWEARSLSGDVYVEFLMGGVAWQWKHDDQTNCWAKESVPYPDSMPRLSLGVKLLNEKNQSFEYDLSSLPAEYLQKVVGGFGWTVSWGDNGVELDPNATTPQPLQPRKIVIEISNIRYEK